MPWPRKLWAVLRRPHFGCRLGLLALLCALAGCRSGDAAVPPGIYVRARVVPLNGPIETAAPTIPPSPVEAPVDLERVLTWAGIANPTIQVAQEAVRAGQAEELQARALLLPTLNAGGSANVHRGNLQTAEGLIRDVNRQSAYVGNGAGAVGSGTVANPGVRLTAPIADAVFEPRVARQRVAALRWTSEATRNQVLLAVVTRYLQLSAAEAQVLALLESEREYGEIARLTANFARIGQGRQGDADRAQSEALLTRAQTQRAEEEVAVASAQLARLLDADPSVAWRTGGTLPMLHLINFGIPVEDLLRLALGNRPELGAAAAGVRIGETRLRQERIRPLAPLVSVGFSAGGFGGGSNLADTNFGHFSSRTDFDVLAYWTLQNMGLGNAATLKQRRAQLNIARAQQLRIVDQVRREVVEARAQVAARRLEIDVVRRRVGTAQQGYRQDLARARNVLGHPIELINSANLLRAARLDLIRVIAGYDLAQFQLFVALGQPPEPALSASGDPTSP